MALEVVWQTAAETLLGELWNAFREARDKIKMFKPIMKDLETTFYSLDDAIQRIEFYSHQMNRQSTPVEEHLIELMREAKELLLVCSTIGRRDYWKQYKYHDKLKKHDDRLVKLLNVGVLPQIWSYQPQMCLAVTKISTALGLELPNFSFNAQRFRGAMALELIEEAAVGTVFGEFARTCMDVKDKAVMFRPTMHQLEDTLESLEPVIKDIELHNHQLNRPQSEIESLIRLMEKGKSLLCKCSRIRRWYDVRRVRYQKKLVAVDKSLLRFLNVDLQAQIARDQKQMLLLFRSTSLGPDHRGHQDLTVGMTVSQIGHAQRGGMTLELVGGAGGLGQVPAEVSNVDLQAQMARNQMQMVLEGTAGKTKLLTPAIVILGCFNLVMFFLLLMYK